MKKSKIKKLQDDEWEKITKWWAGSSLYLTLFYKGREVSFKEKKREYYLYHPDEKPLAIQIDLTKSIFDKKGIYKPKKVLT